MTARLPVREIRHRIVPAHEVRDIAGVTAFFSGQVRRGDWEMPRQLRIVCVLGSTEIDLREARIPSGISMIEVHVILGSVELLLPPGVRVEMSVDTFAGSVEMIHDPTVPIDPDAPTVHVLGSVYLGSVEASVRYPGERASDAKRRIKASLKGGDPRRIGF
jgi:Cell wall-active antibiotics response 4TMS YvqF